MRNVSSKLTKPFNVRTYEKEFAITTGYTQSLSIRNVDKSWWVCFLYFPDFRIVIVSYFPNFLWSLQNGYSPRRLILDDVILQTVPRRSGRWHHKYKSPWYSHLNSATFEKISEGTLHIVIFLVSLTCLRF